MTSFKIYDETNAPEKSKRTLEEVKKNYGFVPNLLGELAESPAALESYLTMNEKLANSTLTPQEQQVLFLAVSYENECHYCMAAHSGIAKMSDCDDGTIEALRNGTDLPDTKTNELVNFARKVVKKQGWTEREDLDRFLSAGFSKENALDVLVAVSMKTLSNYANHILQTPVDEPFKSFEWKKE